MKHLDFTIDFETCALTANAAPMQVAIVPWRREAESDPFILDDTGETTEEQASAWPEPYEAYIDLRSCVVEGMDFDPATVSWWSRRSADAKRAVCEGLAEPVADITVGALNYLRDIVKQYQLDSICLWAHGMDVDCAILRSLCSRFEIDLEDTVPHTSFRDCRTVILEAALIEAERSMAGKSTRANGIALPHQIQADPSLAYNIFPPLPSRYAEGRESHDALYDAMRSTWYTWQALKTLQQ
jgi:hypothetical protein